MKKAWDLCNQDWPGCSITNMMHRKVIVFWGGAISFYSVSCMSDVIFNPSLLNWSSLILTVAHIYIYYIYTYIWSYIYTYIIIYLIYLPMSSKWQEDQQFWAMSRQARAFCSGVASWNDYIPRSQHCESTSSLEASAASFCACGQWIPEARPHNYHLVNSPGMSCPLLLFVTYSMLIL